MVHPQSRLAFLAMPILAIYSIAALYLLFQKNPLLLSRVPLNEHLSQKKGLDALRIPETVTLPGEMLPKSFVRGSLGNNGVLSMENRLTKTLRRSNLLTEPQIHQVQNAGEWFVSEDQIFALGSASLQTFSLDGKSLWSFSFPESPRPHLLLTDQAAFITLPAGQVYCVHRSSGRLLWLSRHQGEFVTEPQLIDGHFLLGLKTQDKNFLAKISIPDGVVAWKAELKDTSLDEAIVLNETGEIVYISSDRKTLKAITTKDGRLIWKYSAGTPVVSTEEKPAEPETLDEVTFTCPPTVFEDRLVICDSRGQLIALNRQKGSEDWRTSLGDPVETSPAFVPRYNFLAAATSKGYLHVVSAKDGESKWKYNLQNPKAHKTVKTARLDGKAIQEMELLWAYDGWVIWASCAEDRLCLFNPKDGRLLWRIPLEGEVASPPQYSSKKKGFLVALRGAKWTSWEKAQFKAENTEPPEIPPWTLGIFEPLSPENKTGGAAPSPVATPANASPGAQPKTESKKP